MKRRKATLKDMENMDSGKAINTNTISSPSIFTSPNSIPPNTVYGQTQSGNITAIPAFDPPAQLKGKEVDELAGILRLTEVEDMGRPWSDLVGESGKRYSILEAFLKLAQMIRDFTPVIRECGDCGEANPHQAFDYVCIKCRDKINA